MKRGKVVLGRAEIEKLKRREPLIIKLKPGMDELEITASILVEWERKPRYSEGSVESMIEAIGMGKRK